MTQYAQTGLPFDLWLEGAPPGLVGTLGVTIEDDNGVVITPRSTAGIVEIAPKNYRARLTAPAVASPPTYVGIWDTGGATPLYWTEDIIVLGYAPPLPAGLAVATSYTTTAEVQAYLAAQPGGVPATWPADSIAQSNLIIAAEKLIDLVGAAQPLDLTTGRRYIPLTQWQPYQLTALKNAVAAQVEYLLRNGTSFFIDEQYDSVQGPDFTTKGKRRMIAPKARRELAGAYMTQNTGKSTT